MFWWKDLWYDESFATFKSYLCQQLALDALFNNDEGLDNPWLSFINWKARIQLEALTPLWLSQDT